MPKKKIQVIKKIYDFLEGSRAKNVLVYGGAGGGKSYTVAQFLLIDRLLRYRNKRLLVTRKTNPSLRQSAMRLMKELLQEYLIPYEDLKSEQLIRLPNGSEILFRGIDDPEKIKSQEFNYIWMEEATEFSEKDYQQLRLRLRRATAGQRNQLYMTFNPVPSWLKAYFFDEHKEEDVAILHTTYKDNPFLDREYTQMLEELREQDEIYYRIYTLGEFAEPEHLIYTHYSVEKVAPPQYDEVIYGLDFGFNNPTACLRIGIKDKDIWIDDELYQSHLTNADLIELLKTFVREKNAPIYCDASEPQRIEEIRRAGFNAWPSAKDVKMGIDFVKRQRLRIRQSCENTLKEIRMYKWREDARGNILDEPVKFFDHALDAMRYAIFTHLRNRTDQPVVVLSHQLERW